MKDYEPTASEHHQKLMRRFFRGRFDSWAQYQDKAKVIWAGEHYILIRTGTSENKSRYVWMADKLGLLAVDEHEDDVAPLERLASSLIHPVQADRARENAEILHDSCQDPGSDEGIFKGRWCKFRLSQCIAYAERREASYEQDLPGWIAEHERLQEESMDEERQARRFSARLVRYARKALPGRSVKMDNRFDNGPSGTRSVALGDDLGSLCFEADPDTQRVEIMAMRHNPIKLNESQFHRFVDLLAKFEEEEAG